MQPFYVLLGTIANGRSKVFDYRYPERIFYVSELAKLCGEGDLEARSGQVTVNGPIRFKSGKVKSTDCRFNGAGHQAALCAEGQTEIKDVHMALRGYNRLREKLDALGNTIETFEK